MQRPRTPLNAWDCDRHLSSNLVAAKGSPPADSFSAKTIEVAQPDPNTLRISISDDDAVAPWELRRSDGDFQCEGKSITIRTAGSLLSSRANPATNAIKTVLALFALSGGVASSSLSFRPLSDGALVMEVSDTEVGTYMLLSSWTSRANGFVRWEPDRTPK